MRKRKRGYMRTKAPLIAKKRPLCISDHWGHYKEGMFVLGDEEKDEEVLRSSMTCPFNTMCISRAKRVTGIFRAVTVKHRHCSEMRSPERCMDSQGCASLPFPKDILW